MAEAGKTDEALPFGLPSKAPCHSRQAEETLQNLLAELEAQGYREDHDWVLLCLDKLGELAKTREDARGAAEMFRRSYRARASKKGCEVGESHEEPLETKENEGKQAVNRRQTWRMRPTIWPFASRRRRLFFSL